MGTEFPIPPEPPANSRRIGFATFAWLVVLILGLGIVRSRRGWTDSRWTRRTTLPRVSATSGTEISGFSPLLLMPGPFWNKPAPWAATPVTRLGNIFVYEGTFQLPAQAAMALYTHGIEKLYADKPDEAAAEQSFQQSVEMDPSAFFVHIELGNLLLKRGAREEALRAYSDALRYAPGDRLLRGPIEEQIKRITHEADGKIPSLRNPE